MQNETTQTPYMAYRDLWDYTRQFALFPLLTEQYHRSEPELEIILKDFPNYAENPEKWFQARPCYQYTKYTMGEFEYEDICVHLENHLTLALRARGLLSQSFGDKPPNILDAFLYIRNQDPQKFKSELWESLIANGLPKWIQNELTFLESKENK